MLNDANVEPTDLPKEAPPVLFVLIDAEEDFDWYSFPFPRDNVSVASIAEQGRAQEVFARWGVKPTYACDYPVVADPKAARIIRDFCEAGEADIGTQLHAWVNPPFDEAVTLANTFAGNLTPQLERAKLEALTERIAGEVGVRPRVYRAGRYGLGPATGEILADLGYDIDTSVVPHTSFASEGGPDFRSLPAKPFWFGAQRRLLELPVTVGFAGLASSFGPLAQPVLQAPGLRRLPIGGALARTRLMERIKLTPEGVDLAAQMRLIRSLMRAGRRVFQLTYHSSSLGLGGGPYVRDEADRRRFLETLETFLRFFKEELGGEMTTPFELHERLARPTAGASLATSQLEAQASGV